MPAKNRAQKKQAAQHAQVQAQQALKTKVAAEWVMKDQELLAKVKSKIGDRQHVMISYQWDSQEIAKDIYTRLKDVGIKLWMDVSGDMVGNMNDAMSEAVENSALIICLLSKKYEGSMNCRKELEFALDIKKRDVVPIKVEKDYRFDHWLGLIIGNRKYIEITEVEMVPAKMDELFYEMASVLLKEVVAAPAPPPSIYVACCHPIGRYGKCSCKAWCLALLVCLSMCTVVCLPYVMYRLKSRKKLFTNKEKAIDYCEKYGISYTAIVYDAEYDKVVFDNQYDPIRGNALICECQRDRRKFIKKWKKTKEAEMNETELKETAN